MAIPFIIGGIALAAGVFGAKKGLDAKKNYNKAEEVVRDAKWDYENTKEKLDAQRDSTSSDLKNLGKLRLETENTLIRRFIENVKQVNQISYKPIKLGNVEVDITAPMIQEIELSSYKAADLLKDGIGAVSSGVLTGIGASGLATSIGVASTGTAISSLSGVAATNATLAWLGGGSLAAGGMGIAGGTAVLGGAIAGPVIAVMGYAAAKKSERALTEAYQHESEIREVIEQLENGISVLTSISTRTNEVGGAIYALSERFDAILLKSEKIIAQKKLLLKQLSQEQKEKIEEYGRKNIIVRFWNWLTRNKPSFDFPDPLSYNNFSNEEQQHYMLLTNFGYALYALLKVKVLDDEGIITPESEQLLLETNNLVKDA